MLDQCILQIFLLLNRRFYSLIVKTKGYSARITTPCVPMCPRQKIITEPDLSLADVPRLKCRAGTIEEKHFSSRQILPLDCCSKTKYYSFGLWSFAPRHWPRNDSFLHVHVVISRGRDELKTLSFAFKASFSQLVHRVMDSSTSICTMIPHIIPNHSPLPPRW